MKSRVPPILSTLLAVAAILLLLLVFHWGWWIAVLIGAGICFAVYLLLLPTEHGSASHEAKPGKPETGMSASLAEARRHLAVIKHESDLVSDGDIKASSLALYGKGDTILKHLSAHPHKIASSRRFLNYYMETAAAILHKYTALAGHFQSGVEIAQLTEKTRRALDLLNDAFDRQYEHLLENDVIDIEADIDLLEKTLKMGG